MTNTLRELWLNKHEPQGRIDITIFFVNLFLLLCHTFLMFVYAGIGHKFMLLANIVSIIIYASYTLTCYKKIDDYILISFLEIWTHMIFATISFGWALAFQNWSFALIVAYFLPAFSGNNKKKAHIRSIIFSTITILTYFILSILTRAVVFGEPMVIGKYAKILLFTANNMFSFFSIVMFAFFFTLSSRRKEKELTRKADYDELTGLYNRYALTQISEEIIKEAKEKKKSYGLAIVDIDFFKKVNDKYGHTSGDLVLKDLAELLKSLIDKGITPGRWGGEEFILIAPTKMSYQAFKNILEKLRLKVSKHEFIIEDGSSINVTISIGSTSIKNVINLENAVSIADENLYEAKKTGRNKLVG